MVDSFRIESASVSDRGLSEKRPQNEDSFLDIPLSGIFAVADGVGGAEAGEVASQMAVEILGEAFVNETDRNDAEEVMRLALERANAAIHQMSNELPQLSSMATTIVALHIAGNIATIGHVGDSRLYRLDAGGTLYRETDDHSMVAEEVRAGRMTAEQAENHPGKNIISRALGAEPTVEVDLKTIMVGPNTTFLICSDGVTRHIGDPEITGLLRTGEQPDAICQRIKEICYQRGAEDNLTAVIVRLAGEGQAHPISAAVPEIDDTDELTVATPRDPIRNEAVDVLEGDELLELETSELRMPFRTSAEPDIFNVHESPVQEHEPVPAQTPVYEPVAAVGKPISDPQSRDHEAEYETVTAIPVESQAFETKNVETPRSSTRGKDGDPETIRNDEKKLAANGNRSSAAGSIARSIGFLLLGAVIGVAGYYLLLANGTPEAVTQPTEMLSSNQPLTAFEDNRRTLDKDPEAALKRFINEPKDAENSFLVGRAYLLTGKYPEAHKAFLEARDLIAAGTVDPSNAITIQTEIAIALAVTNDPLVQKDLKKELEDSRAKVNPSANSNSNSKPPR